MDALAGASSCRQPARVARAVASAEYWPLVRYPHSLTLSLLDNSSSTRIAWMIVFTPSSIGEVGDTAKNSYLFDPGPGGRPLAALAKTAWFTRQRVWVKMGNGSGRIGIVVICGSVSLNNFLIFVCHSRVRIPLSPPLESVI